jgi:hypothetical protein
MKKFFGWSKRCVWFVLGVNLMKVLDTWLYLYQPVKGNRVERLAEEDLNSLDRHFMASSTYAGGICVRGVMMKSEL